MENGQQPPAGMHNKTIAGKPLPPEPQHTGHFTVTGKLSPDGMGTVYQPHVPKLDRTIALELLPPHHASDTDSVAKLVHPNIVQVYADDEDAGTRFIAMKFVEGVSLQKQIAWIARKPAGT
jgi:serine/threonine protein kinase